MLAADASGFPVARNAPIRVVDLHVVVPSIGDRHTVILGEPMQEGVAVRGAWSAWRQRPRGVRASVSVSEERRRAITSRPERGNLKVPSRPVGGRYRFQDLGFAVDTARAVEVAQVMGGAVGVGEEA